METKEEIVNKEDFSAFSTKVFETMDMLKKELDEIRATKKEEPKPEEQKPDAKKPEDETEDKKKSDLDLRLDAVEKSIAEMKEMFTKSASLEKGSVEKIDVNKAALPKEETVNKTSTPRPPADIEAQSHEPLAYRVASGETMPSMRELIDFEKSAKLKNIDKILGNKQEESK